MFFIMSLFCKNIIKKFIIKHAFHTVERKNERILPQLYAWNRFPRPDISVYFIKVKLVPCTCTLPKHVFVILGICFQKIRSKYLGVLEHITDTLPGFLTYKRPETSQNWLYITQMYAINMRI